MKIKDYIVYIVLIILFILYTKGYLFFMIFCVPTGSMRPTINIGDLIITRKLSQKDISKLKVGDIIVFNYNGKNMVHRIIKIKKKNNKYYFDCKGDHINQINYNISYKDVKYKYLFKIGGLAKPIMYVTNKLDKILDHKINDFIYYG